MYREYGDRLGDRARQYAQTNVFLSQRWDAFSLTANVLWYQDLTTPVATELQRTPEIKFFGVRQPVPGLPGFLYETEASLTNFYRVVGDSGLRIDRHPRVYYPIPVAGLFTVTPFAGGRLTYYNQHVVGTRVTKSGVTVEDTTYDPHVRRQAEGGFEVETRATRVFNMNGWGGLPALQHVIEPRATYLMIRGYDQKGNPQYDRDIDRIGRVTQVIYSLTNRVNAKTVAPTDAEAVRWEAVRVALSQVYDIDREISDRQPFKDLQGEFIFDPNAILRFRARRRLQYVRPRGSAGQRGPHGALPRRGGHGGVALRPGRRRQLGGRRGDGAHPRQCRRPREHQLGRGGGNAGGGPGGHSVALSVLFHHGRLRLPQQQREPVPVRHRPPRHRSVRHQRRGRVRPSDPPDRPRAPARGARRRTARRHRPRARRAAASSSAPR